MKQLYITLFIPLLLSCEKLFFEEDVASTSPTDNFEYLWKECDEKYSYFELKNIDWDKVHEEYSAKVNDNISEDSLFNVLGDMLRELKDDHTNLVSYFNISRYGVDRTGPDNFDWRIIQDNYLPDNYYITGPFGHDFLKNTNNEIGYIRFSSFSGIVDDNNIAFMFNRYRNTKGLILDLRENGGGAVNDIFSLLGHFVADRTLLSYSRIKNGPEHNDFSEIEEVWIEPNENNILYLRPVVVLTDRGTYSAGSFTALSIKQIPSMLLVGDTTGGGLGMPNGGQLPNGWTYRFSITQALNLQLDESWENGVPPDVRVTIDWNDRTKDEVIDSAVVLINDVYKAYGY